MAKGQHLTKHQTGIVRRYYEHRDTLTVTKLQETVSDLYLAAGDPAAAKAAAKKWRWAGDALLRLRVESDVVGRIVESKDVEGLARVVGEFGLRV